MQIQQESSVQLCKLYLEKLYNLTLLVYKLVEKLHLHAQREKTERGERKGLEKMEVERVQAIATMSKSMDTIPSEYIRSENEQPAMTTMQGVVLQVPVIDLGSPDEENLVRLIVEASRDWGIFQVVNHGIPDEGIAKLQKAGKEFFELPQEERELIAKPEGYKGVEGYGTKLQKEVEGKKGWVDHLFHKIWPPSAVNYQFWPKNPPSYRFAFFFFFFLTTVCNLNFKFKNNSTCILKF